MRRALLGAGVVIALLVGIVIGWWPRADITRVIEPTYAPLKIRGFDIAVNMLARHGRQAAVVTVCNSTPHRVAALESLAWEGGPLPVTLYAGIPRTWAPGCTTESLIVFADIEPRTYRLLILERALRSDGSNGNVTWVTGRPFVVT